MSQSKTLYGRQALAIPAPLKRRFSPLVWVLGLDWRAFEHAGAKGARRDARKAKAAGREECCPDFPGVLCPTRPEHHGDIEQLGVRVCVRRSDCVFEREQPRVRVKDAHGRQGAQQPVERMRLDGEGGGQLRGAAGAIAEAVGDPERGRHVDRLGHLVAVDQSVQTDRPPFVE
jgi:hypothetical protein